ncbi:hypothetical protein [Aliivibrio fischeri]|uniref:hypothetical protein n=1 Tax=Aliivibrio fischeri TaxID=668 RepID=UPI003735E469
MNIRDGFKAAVENNKVFYKPVIGVGIVSGAIYLNGFLTEYGVPFPLDIGVLASALLVIGVLSIMFVGIATCYILLTSFVNFDPFNTNYHRVINTSKQGIYASRMRNYISFYFFTYLFPIVTVLICLVVYTELMSNYMALLLGVALYLIFPLLYSFAVSKGAFEQLSQRVRFAIKMAIHVFLSQIVSIASLFFFVAILTPRVSSLSNLEFIGVIISFLLVNLFCLIPVFSYRKLDAALAQVNKSITADSLIKNTQVTPVWLVVAMLLFTSYLPAISPYVGELPLRMLNIGGGIDFIAVDGRRQCDSWPSFIISNKTGSTCTTNNGKLLVQFGDRAFALFKDRDSEKVVSLNLSKSSIISDIPDGSVYLRNNKNK